MPGFKPTSVSIHPQVQPQYDALEAAAKRSAKPDAAVWKAFLSVVTRVKADGQWGDVIPRDSIPSFFVRCYGVANLYCVDLAGFRRAFYTIEGRDVVFLDVVDHAQYDKWFNLRKK